MRRRLRITAALVAATLACGGLRSASATQATPVPEPTPPAPKQVDLIADEPGLTYWIYETGTTPGRRDANQGTGITIASFRSLCTVPCSTLIGAGTYTLGVSRPGGGLVSVPPMTLRGDEVLKATYKSRWTMRLGFFLGGLLTVAIGGAVAFSGDQSGGRQALGTSILAVGVLGMVTPIFIQDSARIVEVPR
jgi:hypothetical protein